MIYLLDTNVLIEAKNLYYPLDRIPQFWRWIVEQAEQGRVSIPSAVILEIERGSKEDDLLGWVKTNRKMLEFSEELDREGWTETLTKGYGFSSTAVAEEALVDKRADPYLIAHALANSENRRVVTLEKARSVQVNLPNPRNRKIPTVCSLLGIEYIDTFQLIRILDFRIT